MLDPQSISRFYMKGFPEYSFHEDWRQIWNKHFRVEVGNGVFFKLNKYRRHLNFKSLRSLCIDLSPLHVYMSVLNWLMPDRIQEKKALHRAYPVGGEYVVDVDDYLVTKLHEHRIGRLGVCIGCLEKTKEKTLSFLDAIEENHSDVRVVFSGKRGFHIHVLDFNLRDWTHYRGDDPLKSHEVARFKYTKHLQEACGGFNRSHFILSSDVTRVITYPGSLNGETGLICSSLGDRQAFEAKPVPEIVCEADASRFFRDFVNAYDLVYAHLEPSQLAKGDDRPQMGRRKYGWR